MHMHRRVRTLPIRTKLTLLSVLVVLALSSILYLSWYRDASLRSMSETRAAISRMDLVLLDLQRKQNDFVNLFDQRHRQAFSSTFETFVENTEDLKERFWAMKLPITTLEQLVELTSEYQYLFEVMADLQTQIGKNQSEGLRKDLARAIIDIEALLDKVPNEANVRHALHRQLVILQIFTKDLLLHKQNEDVDRFEGNYAVMMSDIRTLVKDPLIRQHLLDSISEYRRIFLELARVSTEVGLDYEHGLRADIERTVRNAHDTLGRLREELNVAIERQVRDLNLLIGGLAAVFSLAFLIALVLLGRSISSPIRQVTNIMTQLADGDLSVDIPDKPRRDEIGDMLRALRVFKMGAIIRRRTQEELRRAHDELEHRVEERTHELSEEVAQRRRTEHELMRAREDAESANKAKSMFLANMSHELRTPLNAIIGYSEMLQEDATDLGHPDIASDLDKIHTAGRHLLAIINEILDLSKIEAGRIELSPELCSILDVIATVTDTVEPLIATNNNTLHVECAPDIGEMETDVTRLRQILFNFLSNAAKFTENGDITLHIHRERDIEGDSMVFSVTDTGIGMDQKQLDLVFEPFTQADASTTRKYGGTGLGLTVNREFARLMGGEVFGASTPGKGTTFTVRLPVSLRREILDTAH